MRRRPRRWSAVIQPLRDCEEVLPTRPCHWRIHATELQDLCWPSAQDALLVTFGKTKVTPVPGRDNANKPLRNQSFTPRLVLRSAAGKTPAGKCDSMPPSQPHARSLFRIGVEFRRVREFSG